MEGKLNGKDEEIMNRMMMFGGRARSRWEEIRRGGGMG